jgi:hypothetical protein
MFEWWSVLVAWLGGIPTGFAANWLFHKYQRWRTSEGEYFTLTSSRTSIRFEGKVGVVEQDIGEVVEKLLRRALSQPLRHKKRKP